MAFNQRGEGIAIASPPAVNEVGFVHDGQVSGVSCRNTDHHMDNGHGTTDHGPRTTDDATPSLRVVLVVQQVRRP